MPELQAASVVRDTRNWLERVVIGLNLCPFAKAVHVKQQIHYAVSEARDRAVLLHDLGNELDALLAADASVRETTLLIAPCLPGDFLDFNDLLGACERLLRKRKLDGVIQLASFHPRYQFAGTEPDDVTNFTNRSPYPVLHLLREASIDRAVEAFPEAEAIYDANMQTMKALGVGGWTALDVGAHE
ncbi:MAG: DUF1415 domain-containing protein [Pseudomonadota bacterium]